MSSALKLRIWFTTQNMECSNLFDLARLSLRSLHMTLRSLVKKSSKSDFRNSRQIRQPLVGHYDAPVLWLELISYCNLQNSRHPWARCLTIGSRQWCQQFATRYKAFWLLQRLQCIAIESSENAKSARARLCSVLCSPSSVPHARCSPLP